MATSGIVKEFDAVAYRNNYPPPDVLRQLVRKEADKHGIVRPRGYTVSFHHNKDVERHHFGKGHPMKPWRLQLTKQLVTAYGLCYAMDNYETVPATREEMAEFHSEEYLDFIRRISPVNMSEFINGMHTYGLGDDCPVFDGLWDYCSLYAGATLGAAHAIINQQSDIAIAWSGGLHHAHKRSASGFCYINDIVLGILELLRYYFRVLYIDIDVHHGDGVQQAFLSTDRVMTLSFHRYGIDRDRQSAGPEHTPFFPGTGPLTDTGPDHRDSPGRKFSLNVPLEDGIDDSQYTRLFENITGAVIDTYDPQAIVFQCGADSLGGDRLGRLNLNIEAHGQCLEFVKRRNLPMLVLGGGGYTPRNVARTWCHETSLLVDANLGNTLPEHVYHRQAFMGPDYGDGLLYPKLSEVKNANHVNHNTEKELDRIARYIHEQLRYVRNAPSVQMQEVPPNIGSWLEKVREEEDRALEEELEHRRLDKESGTGIRGELAS